MCFREISKFVSTIVSEKLHKVVHIHGLAGQECLLDYLDLRAHGDKIAGVLADTNGCIALAVPPLVYPNLFSCSSDLCLLTFVPFLPCVALRNIEGDTDSLCVALKGDGFVGKVAREENQ